MLTDRMLNLAESQKKFVAEQTAASIFYSGKHQSHSKPVNLASEMSVDYSAAKTNGELQHNNNNNHRNNNNSSPGGGLMGIKAGHIKSERLSPVEMTTLPVQSTGTVTTKNGDGGDVNRRSR